MPSLNCYFLHLKKNNDDVIAAKVAMVDLVVELNLPLSTLVRINKVFKKSKDSDIAERSVEDVPLFGIKFLFFMSAVLLFCQ